MTTDRERLARLVADYASACAWSDGTAREKQDALMAALDALIADRDSAQTAFNECEKTIGDLTNKVIPNIRASLPTNGETPKRFTMWCAASHGHAPMEHAAGEFVLYSALAAALARYDAVKPFLRHIKPCDSALDRCICGLTSALDTVRGDHE